MVNSGVSDVTRARHREILNILSPPKTVTDIQDTLKASHPHEQVVNLETIRRDIRILKSNGQIKATGFTKGREPYYGVASDSAIPVIFNEYTGEFVQPRDFQKTLEHYLTTNTPTAGMLAMLTITDVINRLLTYALYLKDDPKLSYKEELNQAQEDLKIALRLLYNNARMIEQVLNQEAFWTESLLAKIANDPDFRVDEVRKRIDNINLLINKRQSN
jgi:Fe2+ or Zn2+ uptake regulation protein